MRAVFYGLGADGTVGANKNSIKIIGEDTDQLRPGLLRLRLEEVRRHHDFAPALRPAADPVGYLIRRASFVAVPPVQLPRPLSTCSRRPSRAPTFLLNTPFAPDRSGTTCRAKSSSASSSKTSAALRDRRAATWRREPAWADGSTPIMQTCFFALSGVLPRDEAIAHIKHAIEKTYGKRGEEVVQPELRRRRRDARAPARGHGAGRAGIRGRTLPPARVRPRRPTSCSA